MINYAQVRNKGGISFHLSSILAERVSLSQLLPQRSSSSIFYKGTYWIPTVGSVLPGGYARFLALQSYILNRGAQCTQMGNVPKCPFLYGQLTSHTFVYQIKMTSSHPRRLYEKEKWNLKFAALQRINSLVWVVCRIMRKLAPQGFKARTTATGQQQIPWGYSLSVF